MTSKSTKLHPRNKYKINAIAYQEQMKQSREILIDYLRCLRNFKINIIPIFKMLSLPRRWVVDVFIIYQSRQAVLKLGAQDTVVYSCYPVYLYANDAMVAVIRRTEPRQQQVMARGKPGLFPKGYHHIDEINR